MPLEVKKQTLGLVHQSTNQGARTNQPNQGGRRLLSVRIVPGKYSCWVAASSV